MLPTIVLVHGAFAESASWDGVVDPLLAAGHDVIAAANPLRGLASDAESISDLVRSVEGPVVLVAHSYGGAVISNVDADAGDITGAVYVNAFAPASGESCFALAAKFPGSMLGETTIRPVPRSNGTTDLFVSLDRFHDVFCADVAVRSRRGWPSRSDRHAGSARRAFWRDPLWMSVPSWFLIGEEIASSRRPSSTTWRIVPKRPARLTSRRLPRRRRRPTRTRRRISFSRPPR